MGLIEIENLSEDLEFYSCIDNYIEKIENIPKT